MFNDETSKLLEAITTDVHVLRDLSRLDPKRQRVLVAFCYDTFKSPMETTDSLIGPKVDWKELFERYQITLGYAKARGWKYCGWNDDSEALEDMTSEYQDAFPTWQSVIA